MVGYKIKIRKEAVLRCRTPTFPNSEEVEWAQNKMAIIIGMLIINHEVLGRRVLRRQAISSGIYISTWGWGQKTYDDDSSTEVMA